MNILLTSVGRRRYMVDYFKQAIGSGGKVVAACSDGLTTAMSAADVSYVTPLIYDDNYIDTIKSICEQEKIDLMVSLFDIDLPILAKHRDVWKQMGVVSAVSDNSIIDVCNDKLHMCKFLKDAGYAVPQTVTDLSADDMTGPVLIKPRWGMGSMDIYEAIDRTEIQVLYKKAKRDILSSYLKYEAESDKEQSVLVQQKISGQEYGLDIISDLDGNFMTTIVKKKLAMRAGETDIATVEDNPRLYKLGRDLAEKLGSRGSLRGNLDVDVIDDGKELYVIDMNARFGGGYPFSHAAGVDEVGAYVVWASGGRVDEKMLAVSKAGTYAKDINMMEIKQR